MNNKYKCYKKLSHFKDMLQINNEKKKIFPYTDKQFDEDLKKLLNETKTIKNEKECKFEKGVMIIN